MTEYGDEEDANVTFVPMQPKGKQDVGKPGGWRVTQVCNPISSRSCWSTNLQRANFGAGDQMSSSARSRWAVIENLRLCFYFVVPGARIVPTATASTALTRRLGARTARPSASGKTLNNVQCALCSYKSLKLIHMNMFQSWKQYKNQ